MRFLYSIKGVRGLTLRIMNLFFNLRYQKKMGGKVNIFGFPIVFIPKGADVKFGKGVTLISESYFSEPGINHPVMIRVMKKNAKLRIGDHVGISGGGVCVSKEVEIGNHVMLGANAFITDTDFHPVDPQNRRFNKENIGSAKVVIKDNVFLGMNTIVLKGVTIGENSIVGAGSLVVKDIPANEIWGGSPAKFIKKIEVNTPSMANSASNAE